MADLPDLDTSQISFVAFWNAIDDGGVSEIDPEDALSDGSIQNFTLYDNGWEGDYALLNGRTATVRVKRDGWFVAYLDRTENYSQQVGNPDNVRGPWDLLNDWTAPQTNVPDLETNALERAINSLQSELDNAGSIAYSAAAVGLHDYQTSADEYVLFSHQIGVDEADASTDLGFLHSSKTVHKGAVVAAGELQGSTSLNGMTANANWDPDGVNVNLVNETGTDDAEGYGSYDHSSEITSVETEYKSYLESYAIGSYQHADTQIAHLIWSSDA